MAQARRGRDVQGQLQSRQAERGAYRRPTPHHFPCDTARPMKQYRESSARSKGGCCNQRRGGGWMGWGFGSERWKRLCGMESRGKVGRQTRGLGWRMLEDEKGRKDGNAEGWYWQEALCKPGGCRLKMYPTKRVRRRLCEIESTGETSSAAERYSRSLCMCAAFKGAMTPSYPPSLPLSLSLSVSLSSSFSLSHRLDYDHIDHTEYEVSWEGMSLLIMRIFQGRK